jgi:hypothetical protein
MSGSSRVRTDEAGHYRSHDLSVTYVPGDDRICLWSGLAAGK